MSAEAASQVLDACPDAEWRPIFARIRYGGLRCPSEHSALTWGHIDWERGRIHVQSPKTEHRFGGASRVIPIFPELRPHLDAAWDIADPNAVYGVAKHRLSNANLRTQFERILKRAGVKPWPKLFHNQRATRQTELAADFPRHVVCAWTGNTAANASKHYLTVTESDFDRSIAGSSNSKAAQNPAQYPAAPSGTDEQLNPAHERNAPVLQGLTAECVGTSDAQVPRRGVDTLTASTLSNKYLSDSANSRAAFSGAVSTDSPPPVTELDCLSALWPTLPEATRQQVMALIDEASP